MPTPWAHAARASLALSLACAAPQGARALQIVDAIEGQSVLAKISARELTRITIDRARVRAVTGLEGQLLLEKDDHTGAVFVRPTDTTRPVNVFVTADSGRTYALVLQPVDMPADTIVLRDRTQRPAGEPSALERSASHEKLVKSLVVALATGELLPDLELREVGREVALWGEAHFLHERSVLGRRVVGDRYRLTNVGSAPMRIAEAELFKPGVLGIAVESLDLAPGESTAVYVVREREAAE
jgi:conjugal transfer pilus assembly protein TraK